MHPYRPHLQEHDVTPGTQAPVRRAETGIANASLASAGAALAFTMLVLIADALLRSPGAREYAVTNAIQRVSIPFAGEAVHILGNASILAFFVAAWAATVVIAGLVRRWGATVAATIVPIAAISAVAIDQLTPSRPAPDPSLLIRSLGTAAMPGFAIGQVVVATLVSGLLCYVAQSIRSRLIRHTLRGTSALLVVLVGFVQLWLGSLLPADLLMAWTLGGVVLIPMLMLSRRVDEACGGIPLVSAADVPHDAATPNTRALTSTILFNGSTVSKIYRPGFLPRAIYWLAFQAEFPYMRNQAALRAAVQRRNLIGMLTEHWYGTSHVARAIGIDQIAGRYAITSEYVDGSSPTDHDAAREFLTGLVKRFEEAGLPTWQIDPRQPRATDNLIETEDGSYRVVDLESGLVSPLASLCAWRRALRRGLVPMYDDVFFDVTRAYIRRNDATMRAELGDAWVRRLYATLDQAEAETQRWHDSEPRLWSRLLGRRRHHSPNAQSRQVWAMQWFEDAIACWRREDLISTSQAHRLQRKVRSPQFLGVMPHFAVHLGTGLLLRFPLGSIVRVSYTATHFMRVTWRLITRQIGRKEWRAGVEVHSPLVMLFGAVPGFGAFSYLAAKPIRSDHLLLRVGLDSVLLKLPWKLYERSGLRLIVLHAPEVAQRAATALGGNRRPARLFAWSDEHRASAGPYDQPRTIEISAGFGLRGII